MPVSTRVGHAHDCARNPSFQATMPMKSIASECPATAGMRSRSDSASASVDHDCDRYRTSVRRQLDRRRGGGDRRRPSSGHQPGDRRRSSRSCALATPADVDAAVASARAALPGWATARPRPTGRRCWPSWRRWPPSTPTSWSPRRSARPASRCGWPREFDVPGSIDNIDFFAGAARHLEGKATAEYSGDHTSSIRREAVGVVATITPWNYPLQMAVWKVMPALAAGCSGRHQARRADAADHADAGAAGHRGRPARRRVQRRHRRGRRRRHRAGRASRRRRRHVHRVDRRSAAG